MALLQTLPIYISSIIFDLKFQMEKIEFMPKLREVYRYGLEIAILDERNKGCITDDQINDGLL